MCISDLYDVGNNFSLDRDLKLISDADMIRELAEKVIADNPKELAAFKDVSCKHAELFTTSHCWELFNEVNLTFLKYNTSG